MQKATPVNDSLNATTTRWGLPLPVLILLWVVAVVFVWRESFPVGEIHAALLGVGTPAVSNLLVRFEQEIYRLAVLSLSLKARYDPGKTKLRTVWFQLRSVQT